MTCDARRRRDVPRARRLRLIEDGVEITSSVIKVDRRRKRLLVLVRGPSGALLVRDDRSGLMTETRGYRHLRFIWKTT